MSSTLKLDGVRGLKEILAFDGEASTSTQDIKEKLVLDLTSQTQLLLKRCHLKFKRCLGVAFSGYAQRFLYRQLLSINKSFP